MRLASAAHSTPLACFYFIEDVGGVRGRAHRHAYEVLTGPRFPGAAKVQRALYSPNCAAFGSISGMNRLPFLALLLLSPVVLASGPTSKPAVPPKLSLPYVGDALGRRSVDLRLRKPTAGDAEMFTGRVGSPPSLDYIMFDREGAVAVELGEADGQVLKAIAYVRPPTPANAAAFSKRLAIDDKRVKVARENVAAPNGSPLIKLTFEAVPVEFYIAAHKPSDEVADGLRRGVYAAGMTPQEQLMVNDGPGEYEVTVVPRESEAEKDPLAGGAVEVENPNAIAFGAGPHMTMKVAAKDRASAAVNLPAPFNPRRHEVSEVKLVKPRPQNPTAR